MRTDRAKCELMLRLLLEGNGVRATARIVGVEKKTVLRLLVEVGGRCKTFLESAIHKVMVDDVQCDEIWSFCRLKNRTRERLGIPDDALCGDAYTFVAIERNTKLILAWHLGKRTTEDTEEFSFKLARAIRGRTHLSTDGWGPYPNALRNAFGNRIDYGVLVKSYGNSDDERRYSPPRVVSSEKHAVQGSPDEDRICTSHIERQNLSIRMGVRRFTRLTNAFSKKWENHEAALALWFTYYNWCRVHQTIKTTPAVANGLELAPWSVGELLDRTAETR